MFGSAPLLRRSSNRFVPGAAAGGRFHLRDVVGEVDDHLNGLFSWMLVVKVIDVLLDLETVVRDRLAALAERFLEERARCRVDIGPQAEMLPSDPAAHRLLGALFSSRRVRSEARRVGNECVSRCISVWWRIR